MKGSSRVSRALHAGSLTGLLALALLASMALPAQAAAGDLDTSFGGGDGIVITNPGNKGWGNQLAFMTDGSGRFYLTGFNGVAPTQDFSLLRYNYDGTLDTTFGGGDGIVNTDFRSQKDEARAIAVQPDGRILIGGYTAGDYALLRYTTDGVLDTTFANGTGIKVTNIYRQDVIRAILIQSDNRIVVAGYSGPNGAHDFSLARYFPGGALDSSFGTGGRVQTDFGNDEQSRGAVLQSDGKIVVGGYSKIGSGETATYDFAVARYNSNGTLDTTFGTGGIVLTDLDATSVNSSVIRAILLQSDGKIIACGYSGSTGGFPTPKGHPDPDIEAPNQGVGDFAVARYTSSGALDPTFGTTAPGYTITNLGGGDHARGCAFQADGKIVLAGNNSDVQGINDDYAVARYNAGGSLDLTFGGGEGFVSTEMGGNTDGARDVKVDANGRILTAGITSAVGGGYLMSLARYLSS